MNFIKNSIGFFSGDRLREWQSQISNNLFQLERQKKLEKPSQFFIAVYHELDEILKKYNDSKDYIFNLARTIIRYINQELESSEIKKKDFQSIPEIIDYFKDREIEAEHWGKIDFSTGKPQLIDRVEKKPFLSEDESLTMPLR